MDQVIEVTRIHGLMAAAEARARAVELFRALSLPEPETIGSRYPHQVSGGQLQRLSAAMALIGDPKLVIFDEPTTALDVTTQIEVLRAFKSVMKKGGIAGVYVSHDLAVVAQIADHIVVLKGGEVQEVGTTEEILSNAKHPYTRELLSAFEPKPREAADAAESAPAPLLKIENLVAGYGASKTDGLPLVRAVEDVSLKVEKGRNLGIIGESGCGKSTLARAIAGILPAAVGKIVFDGKELGRSARERTRDQLREMQIVFQYADTALNPAKSVEDILDRPLVFYHGMNARARSLRIDECSTWCACSQPASSPPGRAFRRPETARQLRPRARRRSEADPLDEITSALDTVVAAAVIELLKELQRELGLSYIFISHDLSVVEAICDEIVVMYGGKKVEDITPAKIDAPHHPYSQLLFSSVPKLDPAWLDSLEQDPELVRAYCRR